MSSEEEEKEVCPPTPQGECQTKCEEPSTFMGIPLNDGTCTTTCSDGKGGSCTYTSKPDDYKSSSK